MDKFKDFNPEDIISIGIDNLTSKQKYDYINNLIALLYKEQNDQNWFFVRNPENYTKVNRKYPWATKVCYEKVSSKIYQVLQASRGFSFIGDGSVEDNIKKMDLEADMLLKHERNVTRLDELNNYFNDYSSIDNYVEIGFRIPMFLKHFKSKGLECFGYDVAILSILMASYLNHNVEYLDMSTVSNDTDLNLKKNTLVASYHMLEHISDPYKALQSLYLNMKDNSYFHVEIPLEPYPNLKVGHLYQFDKGEMALMLHKCGFEFCFDVCNSIEERYLVKK